MGQAGSAVYLAHRSCACGTHSLVSAHRRDRLDRCCGHWRRAGTCTRLRLRAGARSRSYGGRSCCLRIPVGSARWYLPCGTRGVPPQYPMVGPQLVTRWAALARTPEGSAAQRSTLSCAQHTLVCAAASCAAGARSAMHTHSCAQPRERARTRARAHVRLTSNGCCARTPVSTHSLEHSLAGGRAPADAQRDAREADQPGAHRAVRARSL